MTNGRAGGGCYAAAHMTRARASAAAALLAAGMLTMAACGGSDNGEASRSPDQIVADAAAALRSAHSLKLSLEGAGPQGSETVTAVIAGPGSATVHLSGGSLTVDMVLSAGRLYIRGRQFFAAIDPALAQQVDDNWVSVAANSSAAAPLVGLANLDHIATCAIEHHGTLSRHGTSVIGGVPVVEVRDAGDKPGTIAASLFVATTGSPYPVEIRQTGSGTAGSVPAACGGGQVTLGSSATSRFSDFNGTFTVKAPASALTLPGV